MELTNLIKRSAELLYKLGMPRDIVGLLRQYLVMRTWHYYRYHNPLVYGRHQFLQGKHTALCNTIINTQSGKVTIGDYVVTGYNVMILTGIHDYSKTKMARKKTVFESGYDIVIEEGVWIASGAIVKGNVTIGKNSVICAGSVVTMDIPANVLAGGNPARVIKPLQLEE